MAQLSVVLPTYNEAANIQAMLPELRKGLKGISLDLIVVDDNSRDGTGDAARAADPKANVIVRTTERGLATAVARGFAEARGDWVCVMDADFQHPVEAIHRMFLRAQQGDVDLVVGSRYAAGGSEGEFTASRKTVSRGAALLARLALPPVRKARMTDPMSGLFMVRRSALAGARLRPSGYKIILEVVGRVPLKGVAEVGYVFQPRRAGDSKLGGKVIFQYLGHLATLAVAHPGNRWPLLVVGLVLAAVVGWAAWSLA